jgi:hypothetical protein
MYGELGDELEGERVKVSDMDELVFLWKEYGKVHDKRLTKDAQDLKQQVLGFVQSLPTFHEKAK